MKIYSMNLPAEIQAVTFAKTSRSPKTFQEIADELTEEKSSEFHEKWVVGYGHASVAEHAVLHIAIEDVSMFAAKALEDNRLASYTEKSTRYQVYDPPRFHTPEAVKGSHLEKKYTDHMINLFTAYKNWHAKIKEMLIWEGMKDQPANSAACDMIRGVLPISTHTNLGMTINARSLAHTIRKLRSAPNPELISISDQLEKTGREIAPTLLKYVSGYTTPWYMHGSYKHLVRSEMDWAKGKIVEHPISGRVVAPTKAIIVDYLKASELEYIFKDWNPNDPFPSDLEMYQVAVGLRIPFTIFRDIQRHRMTSQFSTLPLNYGMYHMPRGVRYLQVEKEFIQLFSKSVAISRDIDAINPDESFYPLPMHAPVAMFINTNLREFLHIVLLRTSSAGDPDYVNLVKDLWKDFLEIVPSARGLEKYLGQIKDEREKQRQNKQNRNSAEAQKTLAKEPSV